MIVTIISMTILMPVVMMVIIQCMMMMMMMVVVMTAPLRGVVRMAMVHAAPH